MKGKVSNRQIEILKNLVAELVNDLLLFMIAYLVLADLAGETPGPGLLLTLGLASFFYYLLREKCGSLFLFLLLHPAAAAGILLLYRGSLAGEIVLGLLLLFLLVISIVKRVTSDKWGMEAVLPPVAIGITALLYLLDQGMYGGENGGSLLVMLMGYGAGYFVYHFLQQFLVYIDVNNRTTDHIPVNHVFYRAAALAGGFTAGGVGVIYLCSDRELMGRLGVAVRKILAAILRFLLSLLPWDESPGEVIGEETSLGAATMDMLAEPAEESLLMKILDAFFGVLAIAVSVLLAAAFLWGIWRLIKNGFAGRQRKQAEQPEGSEDRVEALERRKGKKEKKSPFVRRIREALTAQERIRRIYRHTLESAAEKEKRLGRFTQKREWMLQHSTARECCLALFAETEELSRENEDRRRMEELSRENEDWRRTAEKFAQIYEKARYGQESCSREDVQEARELSRRLLKN